MMEEMWQARSEDKQVVLHEEPIGQQIGLENDSLFKFYW